MSLRRTTYLCTRSLPSPRSRQRLLESVFACKTPRGPVTSRGVTRPELRIALVLNGGVSLAVWISGVVHELDRLRRREPPYDGWLGEQPARVDVIAGASAGGINGALLAAAIQGGKPLRDASGQSLRETWIQIGDLAALTRSTREPDPPSLLHGDEYFLEPLERVVKGLLTETTVAQHPLYLYMTTTALRTRRYAPFAT